MRHGRDDHGDDVSAKWVEEPGYRELDCDAFACRATFATQDPTHTALEVRVAAGLADWVRRMLPIGGGSHRHFDFCPEHAETTP